MNTAIGRASQWEPLGPPSAPLANAAQRAEDQTIPGYITAAHDAGVNDVHINAQINHDYLRYGRAIQNTIISDFSFDQQLGHCIPNWFPIAFHVSRTVGDSIAGALAGLELLQEASTGRLIPPDIFDKFGARQNCNWLARLTALWFNLLDIPNDIGVLLLAALRMNYGPLWRPHALLMSVRRIKALLSLARGGSVLEKAEDVLRSAVAMLGAGNQAVYLDIGVAFELFLEWQARNRTASGTDLIEGSSFPANKALARQLFTLAETATTIPYPIKEFAATATPSEGKALLLASAALYQQTAQEVNPSAKKVLIRSANALLALREQRDLLQTAFDEEHDGRAIFGALTPMLRVHFGRVVWNYSTFQANPLAGNWGLFDDRWPAIMDAFETLYKEPEAAWLLPYPYREWLRNLPVQPSA